MSGTQATGAVVDHLVIGAADLASGARWFEASFGVEIGPGGRHPLMATHNRLLQLSAPGWDDLYLELIAVDPAAETGPHAGRARWFGLDDARVRRSLERAPRLLHFVARSTDLGASLAALAALGEDVGEPVAASRPGPSGLLEWQIGVRRDGLPQHGGALPALIEWRGAHPAPAMPQSSVRLQRLCARSAHPDALARAYAAIGLVAVELDRSAPAPALEAEFMTPRGSVVLRGGLDPD